MSSTVFQIPELTQKILTHVHPSATLGVALSCRTLFNALVPVVWRSVDGATQIFGLIPGTEIRVNQESQVITIKLPGSITDVTLERMKFYAQFVQQLELFKHRNYPYLMINWKALLGYAEHFPLLPNLISITINNPHWCWSITHAQLPWMLMFLSPFLLEFRVVGGNEHCLATTSIERVTCLLDSLRRRCPNLHTLQLFPWERRLFEDEHGLVQIGGGREAEARSLEQFFATCSLRRLCTTSMMMHYAGFSGLANISYLESIELNLRGLDCSERLLGLNGLNLFPSLRHLALYHVPDMKVLRRFWGLSALVGQLNSVYLHFGYKFWSLSQNLQIDHIMRLLIEKSPCINVLTPDPLDGAHGYQYPDNMFSLMSRLPLHELRIVTTSSIQRSQLQVGGTAIHNIRILDLPTHCINLLELKLHTRLMPGLKILKLRIDVSGVDWDYSFGDPSEACSLQELHIVDIKFDEDSSEMDWVKIAQFLSCAWPSAQIVLDDGVEPEHAGLKKALVDGARWFRLGY